MGHVHAARPRADDAIAVEPARKPTSAHGSGTLIGRWAAAGNAAITALLAPAVQRQDAPGAESGPLLSPPQVARARSFYTSRPAQYPPAIITQLRSALGLDPAGGVDDALVVAVALWQSTNGAASLPLKVDGMAGPRTLPRIFQHGLNVTGQGELFGAEMQTGVLNEWATLATAEARRDKLVEIVNRRLQAAGVPPVTPAFDANENNLGSFNFPTWAMRLGRTALDAPSRSEAEARDLAETVYHEARHTEQWFRMAQLRAGQGLSAAAIAGELGIPGNIARLAKDAPLERGSMQALIAQGWYDSVYGSGSAHREAVLTELDRAGTALSRAQARFDADPSPANQAALNAANERRRLAIAGHEDLPEENDSWATEDAAAAGITGGTPAPAPATPAPATPAPPTPATPPPAEGPAHDLAPENDLPGGGA